MAWHIGLTSLADVCQSRHLYVEERRGDSYEGRISEQRITISRRAH